MKSTGFVTVRIFRAGTAGGFWRRVEDFQPPGVRVALDRVGLDLDPGQEEAAASLRPAS